MTALAQQIEALNENLASQLPAEILEAFSQSIADLKSQGLENQAPKVGQIFPNFKLSNTLNQPVELKELLQKGSIILAFFRGNWCPYCNLELKALQDRLQDFKGATLVAISPQMATYNEELKNNHALSFDVLTDQDNRLAKQLGISFSLQDFVLPIYQNLGITLSSFNGNDYNELPVLLFLYWIKREPLLILLSILII
ncbi:peroxiredoxin-like family protein [Myroides sp. mNGS23_01]|nr:peroxiredoxin-like family protein [Myroides sp. mNGS23_01]WHT37893.1 peroxiredoxin-like family protein [Myroides sp. mNGS23_01]